MHTKMMMRTKEMVVAICLCTSICHCGFCDPSRFSLIHSTLTATIIIALTISRTVKTEQLFSVYTIQTRNNMFAMRIMNFECNESNQINGCLSSFLTPLTLPSRLRSPSSPLLRTCFVFLSCCPHFILPRDLLPSISLALTKPHMYEHTSLTSHIESCMNSTTSQY